MKNKLIATILSITVLGGVGAVVYNTNKKETEKIQVATKNDNSNNDKSSEGDGKPKDSNNINEDGQASNNNNNVKDESKINESEKNKEEKANVASNVASEKVVSSNNVEIQSDINQQNEIGTKESKVDSEKVTKEEQKVNTQGSATKEKSVSQQQPVEKEKSVSQQQVPQPQQAKVEEIQKSQVAAEEPVKNNTEQVSVATKTTNSEQFMAQVEQAIFKIVNQERSKAGVGPLSYNGTMEKYARIKSKDMGDRGYFNHANPEGQYITTQMHNDGVNYQSWGENIAYIGGGTTDANALATQFMTNWMNSQGHRENILSTKYASIGVGVYKIGSTIYATQEFYK